VSLGRLNEELYVVEADGEPIVPSNMKDIKTDLEASIVVSRKVSDLVQGNGKKLSVIPDGNRGAIIPELTTACWGREFLVSIKGVGARLPMYEEISSEFGGMPLVGEPVFTSESWFGENPWGAMSHQGCMEDKEITENATEYGINGFYICPMARATPLPANIIEHARTKFWYRKLDRGWAYYQQVRLMPTDIRLFYQSDATLGRKTRWVLSAFDIAYPEDIDGFIDNYISSGIAALTLISRTIKGHDADGYRAMDFTDVWLDKDSVIAPDGKIFFADIEGIEWISIRDEKDAHFRMKRQFDRNFYEFMYGLDCLLRERDKMTDSITSREGLRYALGTRLELALQSDTFLSLEKSHSSLHIILKPLMKDIPELKIKMIDFN
jgi:hypothetical protein